jgi:AraC-like DNA-binding protein/effector-binding domain-containing protein
MSVNEVLPLVRDIIRRNGNATLAYLAHRSRRSRFQTHRFFLKATGETLKQFTLRMRLERAAASLIATADPILSIALANGFASHEVFTRAFRRAFGMTPARYRATRALIGSRAQRERHRMLTRSIGPCIRFFHVPAYKKHYDRKILRMSTLSIVRKEVPAQHILFIRRRIAPSQLQATLGECFGKLFAYGARAGLPIAGWPLCRYVSTGLGLWTIEPSMPVATAVTGEGEMQPGLLPAGPVALGIHAGEYENLADTNAAIEKWIEANGFEAQGWAWEQYVTDPGQHPDPKDWRTEVYWPLAK